MELRHPSVRLDLKRRPSSGQPRSENFVNEVERADSRYHPCRVTLRFACKSSFRPMRTGSLTPVGFENSVREVAEAVAG
jgi:hypothetical protein